MKYLIFIPFAILLGLAAGSWAPQRELRALRREVGNLKKELKSPRKGGKLAALNNIITIPKKKTGRKPGQLKPNGRQLEQAADAGEKSRGVSNLTATAASTNGSAHKRTAHQRTLPNPRSENFETDLEEAKELWQTRVEIARSQWLAKLNLNRDEEQLFDEAIANMNDELYLTMEIVAEGLRHNSEMTTEAGLRVVNQVSETLVRTYDNIREVVSVEKQGELENMEMQNFIDPAAFDPLVDVRDKL